LTASPLLSYPSSSCVHTIQETLSASSPPPTSIQVSIVSQSVTVRHLKELSVVDIQSALADAGFDVLTTPSVDHGADSKSGEMNQLLACKQKKHLQQCSLCQEEELHADVDSKLSLNRHIVSSGSDAVVSYMAEDSTGQNLSKVSSINSNHQAGPFCVTLSVGGMTCSSCSGTITKMVSEVEGVSEVAVSLLSKSATVIVDHKELVGAVVEAIEDCGFSAEVTNVAPLDAPNEDSTKGPRIVTLRIDGMFCQ
jgi:P-type Cu+ transporter